jgi:hypothetical protein
VSYRSIGTNSVDEEGRAILGSVRIRTPHVYQEGIRLKEGEKVHVPCEEAADKLRDQAVASDSGPGPSRDMDGTLIPGGVVELAYPWVTQVTGGSNERGVWQDKISILHGLEDSQGVLRQPYAFEYLPGVGL